MTIAKMLEKDGRWLVRNALGEMLAEGMPRAGPLDMEWLAGFLSRW